jgi:hypothetical protein
VRNARAKHSLTLAGRSQYEVRQMMLALGYKVCLLN